MAELLLQYGADINAIVNPNEGHTLLMQFCALTMELNEFQAEVNIEVVQFLLEHGADRNKMSKKGEKAWDLSKKHSKSREIQRLLKEVKQQYFHPNEKSIQTQEAQEENIGEENFKPDLIIESTSIKCGCFSCYK